MMLDFAHPLGAYLHPKCHPKSPKWRQKAPKKHKPVLQNVTSKTDLVRRCPFGALRLSFGNRLAPFGSLLPPFGTLLAPFAYLFAPFGYLLAPRGSLSLPFRRSSSLFGTNFARCTFRTHLQIIVETSIVRSPATNRTNRNFKSVQRYSKICRSHAHPKTQTSKLNL